MIARDSLFAITVIAIAGVPVILFGPGDLTFAARAIFAAIAGWIALCGLMSLAESIYKSKMNGYTAFHALAAFLAAGICAVAVGALLLSDNVPPIYHAILTVPISVLGIFFMTILVLPLFRRGSEKRQPWRKIL